MKADVLRGLAKAALDQGVRPVGTPLLGAGDDGQGPASPTRADAELVTTIAPHMCLVHGLAAAIRLGALRDAHGAARTAARLRDALPPAVRAVAVSLPARAALPQALRRLPTEVYRPSATGWAFSSRVDGRPGASVRLGGLTDPS